MASTARLFSQMGMHYHVVDRLPLFTKVARLVDRQADFTWYPASTLPEVSIFTHTLGLSMYGTPLGFMFQSQNNSFVLPSMTNDQLLPFAANFLELEVRGRAVWVMGRGVWVVDYGGLKGGGYVAMGWASPTWGTEQNGRASPTSLLL
jgi:hypothetical protein